MDREWQRKWGTNLQKGTVALLILACHDVSMYSKDISFLYWVIPVEKLWFFFFFWPSLRYSTCRYKNKPAERNIYLEEFGRVYKCKSQCFGSRQKKSTWICSLASGDVLNSNTSTLLGSTFCESKEQLHILLLESFENTVLQLQVVSCEWGSMLVLLQLHMVKNKKIKDKIALIVIKKTIHKSKILKYN